MTSVARASLVRTAIISVVATLLFCWATWALFLAPRKGGDSIEAFAESMAESLRDGDFSTVKEHVDASFTLDPGNLDRDAALAVIRNEHAAGRFFPYVSLVHPIPGDVDDVVHVAVIGILARGNPEKMRNVDLVPVRLELKIRKTDAGFMVLSARSHLGR